MIIKDLFSDTLRTLWAHKLRTFLTMFGIAWGIVSITLMVAAGEGLRVGQQRVARNFGKNVMIVFAGRTSLQAGGLRAGRLVIWKDTDYKQVQAESPDCEYVMPELGQGNIRVQSQYNNAALLVTGSHPEFTIIRSLDVAQGRFYNWDDIRESRRVAFIGSDAKEQLFPNGAPVMDQTIMVGGKPYTIIGVMRKKDQDSSYDGADVSKIFIPLSTTMMDFPNRQPWPADSMDRLLVAPKSIEQSSACKQQVRNVLARIHRFDPRDKEAAGIWDTAEEAKAFRKMTDGMKYFLGAMGVTTLLLGGLGVMNVMLVAVRERTREIGVRKAVGATAGTIKRQFFLETTIIVFLSGAVGLSIAYGLCALVNLIPMPPFFAGLLPTWSLSFLSFALLGLIAIGSAMYPASRAASIDPIEALRFEAGG